MPQISSTLSSKNGGGMYSHKKSSIVLFVPNPVFSSHSFFYQSVECFSEMFDDVFIFSEPRWETPLPPLVASTLRAIPSARKIPKRPSRGPASGIKNRIFRIIENVSKNFWYSLRSALSDFFFSDEEKNFIKLTEKHGLIGSEKSEVWSLVKSKPNVLWVLNIQQLELALDISSITQSKVVSEFVDVHTYGNEKEKLLQRRTQRKLIARADKVIFSSLAFGDYFDCENESDPIGYYHRPLVPSSIALRTHPVGKEKKVLFFGNMSKTRQIEKLLIGIVKTESLHLTLMGRFLPSSFRAEVEKSIMRLELEEKVKIVPVCSPEKIVSTCEEYDVGLVYFDTCYDDSHKMALPTKIGTYLASGLAILTIKNVGICQFTDKMTEIIYFEDNSQKEIDKKLMALDEMSTDTLEKSKRASLEYAKSYAWDEIGKNAYCSQFSFGWQK